MLTKTLMISKLTKDQIFKRIDKLQEQENLAESNFANQLNNNQDQIARNLKIVKESDENETKALAEIQLVEKELQKLSFENKDLIEWHEAI